MRILLFSLLVIFAIGLFAVPSAFADHTTATVTNAPGSSVPGCEETADGCFIPSTVTIDVGGTVTWDNNDTAAHTATSGSGTDGPSGVFDSSLIMAGSSFSHTFDAPGTYPYFCMVHPWMAGTVIVTAEEANSSADNSTSTAPPPEPELYDEATPTITVTTDKASYIEGETIQISGVVSNSDGSDVIIKLENSSGSTVSVMQVAVDSSGSFSRSIDTGGLLIDGTFIVEARLSSNQSVKSQTTFEAIENAVTVTNAPGSSVPGCEETSDGCFIPSTVYIATGGTVTWDNNDTAAHTATAGSGTEGPSGVFDTSLIMAGSSFSHTFDAPGTYPYFCMVHPWMAGTVVVGDPAEIEAAAAVAEAEAEAAAAEAAAEEAVWMEANPGVVLNAPGSSVPGCEETADGCFIPSTITVSAGQGITWDNNDTAAHTATSGSGTDGPSGVFDSSLIMAGSSFSHTFDAPGTYPYFCMVHPWMAGTVIVQDIGCGPGTVLVDGVCELVPEPEPEPVETEAEVVSQSDEITAGSEIQIETEITNQQDDQQPFAYIVQIKDEIGATISISMITGTVGQGQTITQIISWTPSESGVYVAEVYLWSDLNQPLILSSVETQYITVN